MIPRRWINLNSFGGTKFEQAHNVDNIYVFGIRKYGSGKFEQAHNVENSYVFGIRKYGSGMGTGKVEHKSVAWFCIFEMKTSKTLS